MTEERRIFWAGKYAEYRAALNGYFRRRIAQPEDAEDLAQEVYARLLRADQGERATITNPEAYLYTVAVNLLRERAVLRGHLGQGVTLDEVEAELVGTGLSPGADLDKTRREQQLAEVLETLPPKFRAAIIMHYRCDMTYEQIATKMGVTTHAVKKNISRGLQACRRKMAKG